MERTPHFFEPGVGECVNAAGLLVIEMRFALIRAVCRFFGLSVWGFGCQEVASLSPYVFLIKLLNQLNMESSAQCRGYKCLSLQTVTEIFTRRFSQRRSLIQHSGGFLFPCEVAPLFRGSRFPHKMRMVLRPEFESGLNGF